MKKIYLVLGLVFSFASATTFAQGDDCANAVVVSPGMYTADGPSSGGGAVNTDGSGNADWYSFTAGCDGFIDVESCISGGTDTDLFLYSTACPTLVSENIALDDDGCPGTFSSNLLGIPVTAGTTYYIEWGNQWSSAPFNWQLIFTGPTYTPVVSNVTFDGADLAWSALGAETTWTVEYGPAGFTAGSGTVWNITASPDTTFTGLNPETTYDVYITAPGQCSEIVSFTTPAICPVPNVVGSTPGVTTSMLDWTVGGTEVMWDVEYGLNGFPLGTGTSASGIILGSDTTVTGLMGATDYHWYVRAVCDVVAPYDTTSFWVGPEAFTTLPACNDPSALDTTNSDAFNADLVWVAGGLELEWNIQWGVAGFVIGGTGANIVNGNTTFVESLSGLTPGGDYCFYVQAVCGATPDSISNWAGPYCWTQPTYCTDPSAGLFTNLTTTNVDFDWTAGGTETNWTVEYGMNGFTLGTGTTVMTTATTTSVTGLTSDTDYCFYVQANCGATPDSSSNWAGPFCVTTLVSCPQPTTLNVMNVTNTAVNLIWQAGGTETSWNIEWGYPGFNAGMGEEVGMVAGATTNPYYVTGLLPSTPYEYYVQADCGGGDNSSWSGPFAFNTLLSNDEACDAIKLTVDAPAEIHHNIVGTDNGENTITPPAGPCDGSGTWCNDAQANNPVWFKFTAPAGGGVVVSTDNAYTDDAGSRTEIAVYEVGDCNNYASFVMLDANGDVINGFTGSEVTLCALTAGVEYLIMVDGWSDLGAFTPTPAFQGNFGISVVSAPASVSAGTSVGGSVCEGDATPFDLFTAITGNSSTSGQWYNPSVAPGNELGNLLDFSTVPVGTYPMFYVEGSVCGSDTVETAVSVEVGPNAGSDGTVTSCNTQDVILIQELTGVVELGGTWSDDDATGFLVNGVFMTNAIAAGTYTFTYTVTSTSACPDATSTVTVTITDCLSLGEDNAAVLEVYPNPVVDVLTIKNLNLDGNAVVEIFDIQGKVVMSVQTSDVQGNLDVDMTDLERGVYVVRITNDNSTQEVRVVKQ